MFLRAIFILTASALFISACSEDQEVGTGLQQKQTEVETRQPPPPVNPIENLSVEELTKDKLPACVAACKNRAASCEQGCDYSCRRQCTHQECNFLDKERKSECLKVCFPRCDEGKQCKKYCADASRSCVQTCPKVKSAKELLKKNEEKK